MAKTLGCVEKQIYVAHQKVQIPPQLIDCLEEGNFASKPAVKINCVKTQTW